MQDDLETTSGRTGGSARLSLSSVALPSEHGGWSFTLEPVLLGLLVAWSWRGVVAGLVALGAFMLRTPLKTAVVDRRRGRRLPRTELAERVVLVEALVLGVVIAVVLVGAPAGVWWPVAIAAPLVVIEFWFDIRSRSRRLLPELAGTIGIGAVASVVAMLGGADASVAVGLWLVVAARAVAAVVFVRCQLRRSKQQSDRVGSSDVGQAVAVAATAVGVAVDVVPPVAFAAIAVVATTHLFLVRRPPPSIPMIGAQQVVLGLFVVLTAGLAVIAP